MRAQHVESLQQLNELFTIDADAYQECSLSFDTFRVWWERYPQGSTIIVCDDQIIASIGLWALTYEQFAAFVEGSISEKELLPVTLEECEETPQRHWYASGIVLKQSLRGNLKTNPIKLLLERGLAQWADSGHVDYPLQLLALAEYTAGENMLTRFNFMRVRSGAHLPDKCDLYSLQIRSEEEAEKVLKARRLW